MVTIDAPHPAQYVIAYMRERADLSHEQRLSRGPERRVAVWNDLVATAQRTQAPARSALERLRAGGFVLESRSIPIANAIVVVAAPGASEAVASALRGVAEIEHVLTRPRQLAPGRRDAFTPTNVSLSAADARAASSPSATTWGLERIGAPRAWARGFDGRGVTIGIVDTGLDAQHPAIRGHYRGTRTGTDDHAWIDAAGYTSGTFARAPYDSGGHGTHVAGSAAGGAPDARIGVAPGAELIAARLHFGDDMRAPISELDALQFMLAPTTTDGAHPDARRGADIVNTSWSAYPWEQLAAQPAFDALVAAGTVVVASAGNRGAIRGGRVGSPGGLPGVIAVAASNSTDGIAKLSSPGPSPFDLAGRHPMFAAPGVAVRSSLPGGTYGEALGTSMAAPHVAGAMALLLQARPHASTGELTSALARTAHDVSPAGPDQRSGFGRIDVDAALGALISGSRA